MEVISVQVKGPSLHTEYVQVEPLKTLDFMLRFHIPSFFDGKAKIVPTLTYLFYLYFRLKIEGSEELIAGVATYTAY